MSPQANWDVVGGSTIVANTGFDDRILVFNVLTAKLDTIGLGWVGTSPTHKQRVAAALAEARSIGRLDDAALKEYASQLRRSRRTLEDAFATAAPLATQLLTLDSAHILVRGFDADAWPHGLSSQWALVDLPGRRRFEFDMRVPGIVLAVQAQRAGRVRIVSTVRTADRGHIVVLSEVIIPKPTGPGVDTEHMEGSAAPDRSGLPSRR
jgi:hypothetical protein